MTRPLLVEIDLRALLHTSDRPTPGQTKRGLSVVFCVRAGRSALSAREDFGETCLEPQPTHVRGCGDACHPKQHRHVKLVKLG